MCKVINKSVESELIEKALQLYKKGEITLWRAAELSGISLSCMMDEAHRRKIPHQYSRDDLLLDIDTLKRT
jgi:predicted HTH domain antitoxin